MQNSLTAVLERGNPVGVEVWPAGNRLNHTAQHRHHSFIGESDPVPWGGAYWFPGNAFAYLAKSRGLRGKGVDMIQGPPGRSSLPLRAAPDSGHSGALPTWGIKRQNIGLCRWSLLRIDLSGPAAKGWVALDWERVQHLRVIHNTWHVSIIVGIILYCRIIKKYRLRTYFLLHLQFSSLPGT